MSDNQKPHCHWVQPTGNDEVFFAALRQITDPLVMLECMAENSSYLGTDPYYRDINQAIWDQADRVIRSAGARVVAQERQWFTVPNGTPPDGRPHTLACRLPEILTIKDFGAWGDSTTDDTAAYELCRIQAARSDRPVGVQDGNYLIYGRVMTAAEVVQMINAGERRK